MLLVAEIPGSPVVIAIFSWTWQASRVTIKKCQRTQLAGDRSNQGRFNSVGKYYSREGCVTKCGAKFLNCSVRLSFARSRATPVLTFVCTYYSSAKCILSKETHHISQRSDPFNTQFQN